MGARKQILDFYMLPLLFLVWKSGLITNLANND